MGNVLIVAGKEFRDLLNSRLVLIILAFYVLVLLTSLYLDAGTEGIGTSVGFLLVGPGWDVCYFGSLVAIVLGFSSMSVETSGKALNTLLVKPLYRDTIINGKLLGVLAFMSWIFWITIAIYTIGIYLFASNLLSQYILLYIERLPFVFLLYLLCSLFFYSLSMLMCVIFKEESFALFMGLLSWIILQHMLNNAIIAQNIDYTLHLLFGGEYSSVVNVLSPILLVRAILMGGDASGVVSDIGAWFFSVVPNIFMLALYCFVATVFAYVAFLRRDVS